MTASREQASHISFELSTASPSSRRHLRADRPRPCAADDARDAWNLATRVSSASAFKRGSTHCTVTLSTGLLADLVEINADVA